MTKKEKLDLLRHECGQKIVDQYLMSRRLLKIQKKVYKRYPVQVAADILVVDQLGKAASYVPSQNIILINSDALSDFIKAAYYFLHELRHQYQWENRLKAEDQHALKIGRMMDHTCRFTGIANESNPDYVKYLYQLHEIDANAFAKYYLRNYFNLEVTNNGPEYEEYLNQYIKTHF